MTLKHPANPKNSSRMPSLKVSTGKMAAIPEKLGYSLS